MLTYGFSASAMQGREVVLISIRQNMNESERLAACFTALLKAFAELTAAVPKAALPVSSELSAQCKQNLERAMAALKDQFPPQAVETAAGVAIQQIDQICRANKEALEERDAAVRDVVATVAQAISGFKGSGEIHKSNLSKLADGFEALSRVEDAMELRRRLRDDVGKLRHSVEEMRRDQTQSLGQFEKQISAFQLRLEKARKDSGIDRLTGLGSRREAERHLQSIPSRNRPVYILLFDLQGFRKINEQHGALFGDRLLQALTHLLRTNFPDEASVFRWGADEFLVIREGPLSKATEEGRSIQQTFSGQRYSTIQGETRVTLSANVAFGAAQYIRGESVEQLCRRARESLDQSRQVLRR